MGFPQTTQHRDIVDSYWMRCPWVSILKFSCSGCLPQTLKICESLKYLTQNLHMILTLEQREMFSSFLHSPVIFVLAKDEMVSYNLQHGKLLPTKKSIMSVHPEKTQLRCEIIQSFLKFLCCSQLVLRS